MIEEELQKRYASGLAPPLPVSVWNDRIERCQEILRKKELGAILVYSGGQPLTGTQWARYFANLVHPIWNSDAFVLIPKEGEPMRILNYSFMKELAEKTSLIKDVRTYDYFGANVFTPKRYQNFESMIMNIIKEKGLETKKIGLGRQGMQGDYMPAVLDLALQRACKNATAVDASDILWELISVKTDYDIEMIRKTCEVGCLSLKGAFDALGDGKRVYESFSAFIKTAGELGAEFPGICPETWHFAFKDAVPGSERPNRPFWITSRKLRRGDMIAIDSGTIYYGYPHDMARTGMVAGKPTEKQGKLFDANLNAQKAMEEALRPGVKASELSKINYDAARKAGFDKIHALQGHGIGFLENEPPIITPWCHDIIKERSIINLECVIYEKNIGMSYIEDTYLVTKNGAERLTTAFERELYVK